MWHIEGRGEVLIRFWCRNLNERGELKELDVNGRIILQWILNIMGGQGLG
jgi:hypothetical protein